MTWDEVIRWFDQNTWIGTVFLIVFISLVIRLLLKFVFDRLAHAASATTNRYDDALFRVARKPVGWAVVLFGILLAATVVRDNTEAGLLDYIPQAREVTAILLLGWFAMRFIQEMADTVVASREDRNSDDIGTIQTIAKLLRISVVITGALICLQTLGFSITGVLAFGGIGGIAIGFAARDVLANFFGALMLMLDKPFKVGDWIRSSEMEIEGTVEDIGWRVTRIRTFDKRPLYVPNSHFSNITIENPSRMTNRRIYETLTVRYDDVQVLAIILKDLRTMLHEHPEIDTDQILMVNLDEFGESSADFFIYTFTKTTDWAFFHEIKEDVLMRVATIIEGHGAHIAFPTRTLHVEPSLLPQTAS